MISSSPVRASWLGVLTLTLFTACSERDTRNASDAPDNAPNSQPEALPSRNVAALDHAASWRGEIPCADCAGILTTVTLYPNGTFRTEGAYLGTNGSGDTIAASFGRWTHQNNATRLRLQGSMEAPLLYAIDPDGALRLLDVSGNDINSTANYRLTAISDPIALTHPARLIGAFSYMADAANFVECRSGLRYPVDMSAESPALQRAYAQAGGNGQPRIMRVSAHLDDRPAMEGDSTTLALVVDSVHSSNADDGCSALRIQDSLALNTWRLVAVESANAEPLPVSDSTDAGFRWEREETRLSGSGGCNRFSARAVMRGTTLVGSAAAATKRMCNAPGVMEIEQRIFELLALDVSVRLDADTLVWSHGPRDVARFVARAPYPAD